MHDIYKTDFGCPIHKLAKDIMLRARSYVSDSRPINIDTLRADAIKLRTKIGQLDYGILEQRRDLLFYLSNACNRLDGTKDEILTRELKLAYSMVSSAVKNKGHGKVYQ